MRSWFFIINYFAHDFFSAFWLACFIVLVILRQSAGVPGQVSADGVLATDLLHLFFWLQTISLGLIAVTGYLRSKDTGGREAQDPNKAKQFLIIKHAVLGLFFLAGTVVSILWYLS